MCRNNSYVGIWLWPKADEGLIDKTLLFHSRGIRKGCDCSWRSFSDNINDVVLSRSKRIGSNIMLPLSTKRLKRGHTHSKVSHVFCIILINQPPTSFSPQPSCVLCRVPKSPVDARDVCFRLESTYSIADIDVRMRTG